MELTSFFIRCRFAPSSVVLPPMLSCLPPCFLAEARTEAAGESRNRASRGVGSARSLIQAIEAYTESIPPSRIFDSIGPEIAL